MYITVGERVLKEIYENIDFIGHKEALNTMKKDLNCSEIALKRALILCKEKINILLQQQGMEFDEEREDKLINLQLSQNIIERLLSEKGNKYKKTSTKVDALETFEVGQRYIVKTYEELENTTGVYKDEDEALRMGKKRDSFIMEMKNISGEEFVFEHNGTCSRKVNVSGWNVYPWMCKKIPNTKTEPVFEIGKKYVIRSWEELKTLPGVEETTLCNSKYLKHKEHSCRFSKTMKFLCGTSIVGEGQKCVKIANYYIYPWMCKTEDTEVEQEVCVTKEDVEISGANIPKILGCETEFNLCNAIKNIIEYKNTHEKEYLEKAIWYIKRELKNMEEK